MKTQKIATLSTIAIATAFLTGAVANADETQNNADSNSQLLVDNSNSELKVTTQTIQPTDGLTKAVETAKEAGITVASGQTVNNLTESQAHEAMDAKAQEVNQVVTDYKEAQAKYEADKAEYDKNMAEAEANTTKEGHLSQVAEQGLVYEANSEPNTKAEVTSGHIVSEEEVQEAARQSDTGDKDYLVNLVLDPNSDFIDSGVYVALKAGEITTVRYTGLENATYNGQKITAVEYDYTPDKNVYAILYDDPTITIGLMNFSQAVDVATKVRFYNANNELITLTKNALFGFNSLNRGKGERYTDKTEYVQSDAGYITINGSTIAVHADGKAYADSTNDADVIGDWDEATNPNFYKGSIVGLTKDGKLSFHFGNDGRVWQWFAINSTIPVSSLPVLPTVPTVPTVTVDNYEIITAVPVVPPVDGEEKPEFIIPVKPTDPEQPTEPKTPTSPEAPKMPSNGFGAKREEITTVTYKTQPAQREVTKNTVYGGELPLTGEKEGITSTLGLIVISLGITGLALSYKKWTEEEKTNGNQMH